jgi:hypothetical protein
MSMDPSPKFLFVVQMSVDPKHDREVRSAYADHVRSLVDVPGVLGAIRTITIPGAKARLAGSTVGLPSGETTDYVTFYELESPEILMSDAWSAAVDTGRWATDARRLTRDRRHQVVRVVQSVRGMAGGGRGNGPLT